MHGFPVFTVIPSITLQMKSTDNGADVTLEELIVQSIKKATQSATYRGEGMDCAALEKGSLLGSWWLLELWRQGSGGLE